MHNPLSMLHRSLPALLALILLVPAASPADPDSKSEAHLAERARLAAACQGSDDPAPCLEFARFLTEGCAEVETASGMFRQLCIDGSREACSEWSRLAMLGGWDPSAVTEAKGRGCELGNEDDCFVYASVLMLAPPASDPVKMGRAILEKQCGEARAEACGFLAVDYRDRARRFEHPEAKREAMRLAENFALAGCGLGDPASCNELGRHLSREGRSVTDTAKARSAFFKACEADHDRGCANLGLMLLTGQGGTADPPRARILYRRACALGNTDACSILGLGMLDGTFGPADPRTARTAFARGCRSGDGGACARLAELLAGEGRSDDAVFFARLSCAGGLPAGCEALIRALEQTEEANRDVELLRSALGASCRLDNEAHCLRFLEAAGTRVHRAGGAFYRIEGHAQVMKQRGRPVAPEVAVLWAEMNAKKLSQCVEHDLENAGENEIILRGEIKVNGRGEIKKSSLVPAVEMPQEQMECLLSIVESSRLPGHRGAARPSVELSLILEPIEPQPLSGPAPHHIATLAVKSSVLHSDCPGPVTDAMAPGWDWIDWELSAGGDPEADALDADSLFADDQVVKENLADVTVCRLRYGGDPGLIGSFRLDLSISESGAVESTQAWDVALDAAGVVDCVSERAARWVFPAGEARARTIGFDLVVTP